MVGNRFEAYSGSFEDGPLRKHRGQRVHLMGVLERLPDADVRQAAVGSVDAHVVVET